MQTISKESFKDAANFIFSQIDQRLKGLEERSSNQENVIKSIKKNRKLAHIITKPYVKDQAQDDLTPTGGAISLDVREYIRSKYPEADGYLNEKDLGYTLPSLAIEESQMDVIQLLSNSILDKSLPKQSPYFDDRRSSKESSPIKRGEFSPYKRGRSGIDIEYLPCTQVEEEFSQIQDDKKVSLNKSVDRGRMSNYSSPKAGGSNILSSSKGLLAAKNVLKGLKGMAREFRDK